MARRRVNRRNSWVAVATLVTLLAAPLSLLAQTKISYHSNKFSAQDDVKLGRQAAQEAEQQYPLLRDEQARAYVERVGQRLVSAIPAEFQHPEFHYYFKIVNASDINAFALPGGPMYVNRGMIDAARNEGEMAGVMCHELSHVALRHGTAQATKAQKYSTLSSVLGMGGAILGGPLGSAAQMGAKGVGESPNVGSPAAFVNAVIDALSPLGVRHIDMPLTRDKVWRAIRDAEAKKA